MMTATAYAARGPPGQDARVDPNFSASAPMCGKLSSADAELRAATARDEQGNSNGEQTGILRASA